VYVNEGAEQPSMLKSLKEVMKDPDKSALRILLAIFLWFVAYSAIEAFFSLYAVNQLGLQDSDGPRLLGQLSLIFVIFAIPAGIIGARIGRRLTISIGIILMAGSDAGDVRFLPGCDAEPVGYDPANIGEGADYWPVLDGGGRGVGADQYQLTADGRRYDRRGPAGHLHRDLLPVLPPCRPSLDPT